MSQHLILVPSLACPAGCAYCFGPHTGGKTMGRETPLALARRVATTDEGPYALTEADATLAITTLLRLMQRHPFSPVA